MRRRSTLWAVVILVTAIAAVVGVLVVLAKQEPDYYTAMGTAAEDDPLVAGEVVTRFGDLKNDIRSKPEWGASFTSLELNAFLRDQLEEGEGLSEVLPAGLHNPRVSIEGDKLKLAARIGKGTWSTVVSVELRAWLVNQEINTLAVEFCGMWAGWIPLSSQSMLDRISESARESNIEVTWYRHNGHPVGLFRFYADQPQPSTQIRTVKIADGAVTLAGRTGLKSPGSRLNDFIAP